MIQVVCVLCLMAAGVFGMYASPRPYEVTQPDGTVVTLKMNGGPGWYYESDASGFPVVADGRGYVDYATQDAVDGHLEDTGVKVGIEEPPPEAPPPSPKPA